MAPPKQNQIFITWSVLYDMLKTKRYVVTERCVQYSYYTVDAIDEDDARDLTSEGHGDYCDGDSYDHQYIEVTEI